MKTKPTSEQPSSAAEIPVDVGVVIFLSVEKLDSSDRVCVWGGEFGLIGN